MQFGKDILTATSPCPNRGRAVQRLKFHHGLARSLCSQRASRLIKLGSAHPPTPFALPQMPGAPQESGAYVVPGFEAIV